MTMTRLEAVFADITTLDVDAVVNAANNALAPGGGVCGAIHRAAGPKLGVACMTRRPCPTGEARITPGFNLRARHVIHAVGPRWQGGAAGEAASLAAAYRSSLDLARQHTLATIAFPAISTGVYAYPLDEATQIAVATVRISLSQPGSIRHVIFATVDQRTLDAYGRQGVATVGLEPAAKTQISIDSRALLGDHGQLWTMRCDPKTPVHQFLDDVWYELRRFVRARHYPDGWVLRDRATGHVFDNLGPGWAARHGQVQDGRPITAVGIVHESELEVIAGPESKSVFKENPLGS